MLYSLNQHRSYAPIFFIPYPCSKGPFPLSDRDCDVTTIGYIGVYGPIPTADCDSDVAIAEMGSVPKLQTKSLSGNGDPFR